MRSTVRKACAAFLAAAAVAGPASSAFAGQPEWIRQFGTRTDEDARGVATGPDGRVHVLGSTQGNFFGTGKGGFDSFVVTFDPDGKELWRRQPGTTESDTPYAITTDVDGNVYITGVTSGSLGGANKGGGDAFLIKFDRNGRILWKRQPGTAKYDWGKSVATDANGNVFLVGDTEGALGGANKGLVDVFMIKFDRNGRILWNRHMGTSQRDEARAVVADADGNVYLAGQTTGALAGTNRGYYDAYIVKFDGSGRILWKRQLGTTDFDGVDGVVADTDGNVYVAGTTKGALGGASAGDVDAFVIKFDSTGGILWKRQLGTTAYETAHGAATGADGSIYIVGQTDGALGGSSHGNVDCFVIQLDRDGNTIGSDQPGTAVLDVANGVAADTEGNVYVVGSTIGALAASSRGGSDDFLIKYGVAGLQ